MGTDMLCKPSPEIEVWRSVKMTRGDGLDDMRVGKTVHRNQRERTQ